VVDFTKPLQTPRGFRFSFPRCFFRTGGANRPPFGPVHRATTRFSSFRVLASLSFPVLGTTERPTWIASRRTRSSMWEVLSGPSQVYRSPGSVSKGELASHSRVDPRNSPDRREVLQPRCCLEGTSPGVCSFAKGRDSWNYRPFQEECFVEPTLVGSQQSTLALPLLKPQVLHFPREPVHRTQEHQPRRWTSRASRTPWLPDLSPSTSLGVFYRPGGFKPYTQLATVHTLWLFYSLNNLDLWLPEFSLLAHAR